MRDSVGATAVGALGAYAVGPPEGTKYTGTGAATMGAGKASSACASAGARRSAAPKSDDRVFMADSLSSARATPPER